MSKLNEWLNKEGFTTGPVGTNTSSKTTQDKNTKTETKKAPAPQKAKPEQRTPKTQTKTNNRPPQTKARTGKQAPKKSFGGKRPSLNSKPTNHDPTHGRPSHEKREKFHPTNYMKGKAGDIRIVPLGGMEEVGMNMGFIEWGNDILVIDMGLLFPNPEHLGVDILIPGIKYLEENKKRIKGVFITHGHLDHIGGVPYMIEKLGWPTLYASRLTKELIFANSAEHIDLKRLKVVEINPKSQIKLGKFDMEFFHVNHSIPDCLGLVVNTPYGSIVHTADFKIDHNPADDMPADLGRIAQIGKKGVAIAMVDSTNATKPGHTMSESIIEKDLAKIVHGVKGRLIITTFASSIGRIGKIVEAAEAAGRTVFLSGRSMEKNIMIARKLNYLKCKDKTVQLMNRKANSMDPNKVLILSTGSQGEELAALTRMAAGVHRDVKLSKNDTIVFSSSPIPGNETAIVSVMNNLAETQCKIIDKTDMNVYVSGHGHKEEVKLMTSLLNPKFFLPVHGEICMRYGHRDVVVNELGFKMENTFIMKNGLGVVLNAKGCRLMNEKEKIVTAPVLIEMGEAINEHVLADRTLMADNGILIIAIEHNKGSFKEAHIKSRGFRYMGMKHEIFDLLAKEMKEVYTRSFDPARPTKALEQTLRASAEKILLQKFKQKMLVEVLL